MIGQATLGVDTDGIEMTTEIFDTNSSYWFHQQRVPWLFGGFLLAFATRICECTNFDCDAAATYHFDVG